MVEVPCAFLQLGFPPYLELELSTPANFGELMLRFDKLSFTTKITESLINRPALNDLSKCKMTALKVSYQGGLGLLNKECGFVTRGSIFK